MAAARRLSIHGRVQGVFYRAWAVQTARALGLVGWVRNRRDGTVEAFVQGSDADLDGFVERARSGPPAARVERIECAAAESDESLTEFAQRETA